MLYLDSALHDFLLVVLRKVGQYNFWFTGKERGPWPELSPGEGGSCSLEKNAY
jgi:hypothetical protein